MEPTKADIKKLRRQVARDRLRVVDGGKAKDDDSPKRGDGNGGGVRKA